MGTNSSYCVDSLEENIGLLKTGLDGAVFKAAYLFQVEALSQTRLRYLVDLLEHSC